MVNLQLIKIALSSLALFAVMRCASKGNMLRSSLLSATSTYDAIVKKKPKKQVAITIMLTQADDHGRGGQIRESLDGAATLRQSILKVYNLTQGRTVERMVGLEPYNRNNTKSVAWMKSQVENVSVYDVPMAGARDETVELRFIAMVDVDVEEKWMNILRIHGFEVWKSCTPMEHTEVRNNDTAQSMKESGAIGTTELIKLEGLRMKGFTSVLFVDCDVIFHKPFDELFAIEENYAWTVGGYEQEKINGGFLVYNPDHPASMHHMNAIIEVLKEGDFRGGSGWRGSGIGWGWGGQTIQGILPYYYFFEAEKEQAMFEQRLNITLAPAHKEIDRCKYNNMAQTENCTNFTKFEEVTSNHFTSTCFKPWYCPDESINPLCDKFHSVFATTYKEMVLELAHARNDTMNDSEIVQHAKDVKEGEWCKGKQFMSVSAYLAEHL